MENNVDKAIDKVNPENYKNYFQYAYGIKEDTTYKRKPSSRKCKLKNINHNYLKIYICNMLDMNIEDILIENEKLKAENIELKHQLETYSKPQRSYYERNKEFVNQKAKDRMKKISQENPDKLKEINRKAYLKRKEKLSVNQNENI